MNKTNIKNILIFITLIGVVFGMYYQSLFFGFLSDDYHFLYITSLQDSVWKYFNTNNVGEASGGSYGPIWNVLFTLEYQLFHLNAIGYHAVSLIIYSVTAFIIYAWIKRFTESPVIGFISACLFVVLSGHVESVSWIAVQPHMFASLFACVSLYAYYRFVETKKKRLFMLSLVSFSFSVFIKETAIMLPCVLLLIEFFFGGWDGVWNTAKRLVARLLPFGIISMIFIWLRYRIVGYVFGYYGSVGDSISSIAKLKTFVEITVSHIISYPYRQLVSQWFFRHDIWFIVCMLVMLGIMIFVIHKEYRKIAWFLFATYGVLIYPFLSLQLNPVNNEGERYGYFVSIFFVMWLVVVLYGIFSKIKYGNFILYSIAIVGSLMMAYQIPSKLDDYTHAAHTRDRILEDFRSFDFQSNHYVLIVGLPDNLTGAPIFRNAIKEAIYLTSNKGYLFGERIPLYTELNASRAGKTMVTLEQKEYTYQFTATNNMDKSIFTGFATFKHELADFKMNNFVRLGFKGEAIDIDFNIDILKKYTEQDKKVMLAFFDGKKMNFVEVK